MQETDTNPASGERNAWDYVAWLATAALLVSTGVGLYLAFAMDSQMQYLTDVTSVLFIVLWMVAQAQSRKQQRV